MTLADLDIALADIEFAAPVTPDDCGAVRDALREVFPKASIEVYCHTNVEVIVVVDQCRKAFAVIQAA